MDVLDYIRQCEPLNSRRIGVFPVERRAGQVVADGKRQLSAYGGWRL